MPETLVIEQNSSICLFIAAVDEWLATRESFTSIEDFLLG